MSQSLHQSYAHIVFSTKGRAPLITERIESKLHAYLVGIIKGLGASPIIINGMPDHVHVLVRTNKNITDAEFLQQLKGSCSRWVTKEFGISFNWQTGYGWFSVSPCNVDAAKAYIENQKEHHRTVSFKEEFVNFLKKYKVEYDEQYLWVD